MNVKSDLLIELTFFGTLKTPFVKDALCLQASRMVAGRLKIYVYVCMYVCLHVCVYEGIPSTS